MPLPVIILLIVIGAILVLLLLGFICLYFASKAPFKGAYVNETKEDCAKSSFLEGPQYAPYKEKIQKNLDEAKAIPFEPVYIKGFDGAKLYGQVYKFNDSKFVQIQFHGYKGSGRRDMCGFLLDARDNGLNVIVVDQRSHGKSEGNVVSFGIRERKDVKCWVEYAKKVFGEDCKIVIKGLSMGAATVLMSLDMNLQDNVKCVIADCPFDAPINELTKVALEERTKLPEGAARFMLKVAALIHGHFNITESSAVEAVKNTKTPILLLHGDADNFVPFTFSENIYKANPEMVEFHKFSGAGHALSYFVDTTEYKRITKEFLKKHLLKQD